MKLAKRLRQIALLMLITWLGLTVAGCTDAGVSGVNPVGTDLDAESTINMAGTSTDTGKSVNKSPVINLSIQSTSVGAGAELSLSAEALDPDGDAITFEWGSSDGVFITSARNNAVWKAPDMPMVASLSCKVIDTQGAQTTAYATVQVLGNGTYRLVVTADRSSLLTGRITQVEGLSYVPLAGARVELSSTGEIGITDTSGVVEFQIDAASSVSDTTNVTVKCYDWDVTYEATLRPAVGSKVIDYINFYPGFDGVTVAVAKGDSFAIKRGAVEVTAVESLYGDIKPVPEVTVDVGSSQGLSALTSGIALVSSPYVSNGEINLRLAKTGYQTIDGYQIPVSLDGLTLINARLDKSDAIPSTDAILSWTKPYNSQKSFPVTGPFELGFGQAMEKETILNDISLMIQNKETGSVMSFDGPAIKNNFRVEWVGNTILKLYPLKPLQALSRYSLVISSWVARTADGRILKSYNGVYGEFFTDADPVPSIVSTSPVNGDVGIGRTGPFIVNFDRAMDKTTFLKDLEIEITNLKSGSKVTLDEISMQSYFSITWTNKDTSLELVPYRMLQPNNAYLIKVIKCNLQSESGKTVDGISNLWGQFETSGL